jgi:NCAIR mutase (PurE)-related protein
MKSQLEDILNQVQKGDLSPKEALKRLKDYPYQDLAFAKINHHRELRRGFPEIIFGLGKTAEQIIKISREILKKGDNLLITKVDSSVYKKVKAKLPKVRYPRCRRSRSYLRDLRE